MKAKFVSENLNEDYYDEDQAVVQDEPNLSREDELEMQDEFEAALKNELKVPEFSRRAISFRLRGQNDIIDAVPMARLKDGSYLMKVGDKFKKFNLNDIIEESFKS